MPPLPPVLCLEEEERPNCWLLATRASSSQPSAVARYLACGGRVWREGPWVCGC